MTYLYNAILGLICNFSLSCISIFFSFDPSFLLFADIFSVLLPSPSLCFTLLRLTHLYFHLIPAYATAYIFVVTDLMSLYWLSFYLAI